MSKTKQAAVKPRKWKALGLRTKFRAVATRPMREGAPRLFVHHSVSMRRDVASMSQRIGRCVMFQKMGDMSQLITAQRAAERDTAASFLVLELLDIKNNHTNNTIFHNSITQLYKVSQLAFKLLHKYAEAVLNGHPQEKKLFIYWTDFLLLFFLTVSLEHLFPSS